MEQKKKKSRRDSVRKGAEGSRINDFIMPLRNIKMRKITVRGERGDKCVRERVCAEVIFLFNGIRLLVLCSQTSDLQYKV